MPLVPECQLRELGQRQTCSRICHSYVKLRTTDVYEIGDSNVPALVGIRGPVDITTTNLPSFVEFVSIFAEIAFRVAEPDWLSEQVWIVVGLWINVQLSKMLVR